MLPKIQRILPKIFLIFLVELYVINEIKCFPNLRYEPNDIIYDTTDSIPEFDENFTNEFFRPTDQSYNANPDEVVLIDPERVSEIFPQEDINNYNSLQQLNSIPYEEARQNLDEPNQMNTIIIDTPNTGIANDDLGDDVNFNFNQDDANNQFLISNYQNEYLPNDYQNSYLIQLDDSWPRDDESQIIVIFEESTENETIVQQSEKPYIKVNTTTNFATTFTTQNTTHLVLNSTIKNTLMTFNTTKSFNNSTLSLNSTKIMFNFTSTNLPNSTKFIRENTTKSTTLFNKTTSTSTTAPSIFKALDALRISDDDLKINTDKFMKSPNIVGETFEEIDSKIAYFDEQPNSLLIVKKQVDEDKAKDSQKSR